MLGTLKKRPCTMQSAGALRATTFCPFGYLPMCHKCYGSARLALFTASLTKKCIVWKGAFSNGNVFCRTEWVGIVGYSGMNHAWAMRQASQDRCEFKQKQLLHLKSRRIPPPKAPHQCTVLDGNIMAPATTVLGVAIERYSWRVGFVSGKLMVQWTFTKRQTCWNS